MVVKKILYITAYIHEHSKRPCFYQSSIIFGISEKQDEKKYAKRFVKLVKSQTLIQLQKYILYVYLF